ncbi:RES family NAD+ phosphorylase [Streptomyces sp. NPDC088246]|uniref:RES family NAD+ phosphorylase n=1 Tax=Streptomyces sp. NPDC088246 TaxID=3365842 RepID=UPI00380F4396
MMNCRFFPMIDLVLCPNFHTIPAGTQLWRVHQSKYAPDGFNPKLSDIHFGGGRFEGTVLDPYHYLYLADTPVTALAESVLRSLPFAHPLEMRDIPYVTVHGRSLSCLRTRYDLTLVSLIKGTDLAAVRQHSTLLEDESNYATARRWSSEIRAQAPDAQGLIWDSRRNRSEHALVLYHDRFEHGNGGPLEVVPGRGIPELGSREGREQANELLKPLWAEISKPVAW